MASVLHYGNCRALELDLPPGKLLAEFTNPSGTVIDDPAAAVTAALADPIGFPPLTRATVSGDRVAVALDGGLSRHPVLIAGVIRAVLDCGIQPEAISVVEPADGDGRPGPDPRRGLPGRLAKRVTRVVHDPTDRRRLCYLAASATGRAIYLNRAIHDAELVLPVSCVRPSRSLGVHGMHAGLFPTFSDQETVERFGDPLSVKSGARQRRQWKETDEVGWLLGISMTIRVVPAADGRVLAILAGEGCSVFEQAQSLCDAAWDFPIPRRASLVIASIGDDGSEQTWPNVARALAASGHAVAENGAIVICADLSGCPKQAFGHPDATGDGDVAAVMTGTESRGHVYLMSGLADQAVEQLGMIPVAGGDEIGRLARQHETCILLGNAQYAVPTALEERVTTG